VLCADLKFCSGCACMWMWMCMCICMYVYVYLNVFVYPRLKVLRKKTAYVTKD
jgi:hypothetical protein